MSLSKSGYCQGACVRVGGGCRVGVGGCHGRVGPAMGLLEVK